MSTTGDCYEGSALSVSPPANVLLRGPSMSSEAASVCPRVGDCDWDALLLVSLSGSPDHRLEAWRRHGGLPENVAVLSAEESRGAAAVETPSPTMTAGSQRSISTATVTSPGDLTGIGIKLSQCLSAWEKEDLRICVCFDSVTTLLQYVGTRTSFRFLHMTAKRIRDAGALAHYHIDPGAHDEQTLATLEGVFSNVFEYSTEAGAWERC